jgi:septum formation protein
MRKLTDEEIDWYIKNEKDIFNHCCFVVPGKGNALIEKIDGDYYNALGIPINKLINELYNLGYKLNDLPMKN